MNTLKRKTIFSIGFFLISISLFFIFQNFTSEAFFNEACYLQRYPDVANNWTGETFDHFNLHGRLEGRIPGCDDKVPTYSFSASFKAPSSKQGISEARFSMSTYDFDHRYQKLKSSGTAYRQYNLWWSALESSRLSSSKSPIDCPSGYQLFPANNTEKEVLGYHRYRCISLGALNTFDNLFQRDQTAGMQSGVVLWSSPPVYRYPGCLGFGFGGNDLKDGCVPRDDAMDDFEDYINLVASRYNGGTYGKISHFIIWNENASPDWFDYSPVTNKTDLSSFSIEKRIDKYADMLKRVHAVLMRHQKNALMYVSTDQIWDSGKSPGHFGTRRLLDGLWARLGIKYSWSVAVHPYGDVDQTASPGFYTFNNLESVVQHQVQKLQSLRISNPNSYPQTLLIASEQGWPLVTASGVAGAYGRENQARQMCLAHDKVMSMNQVVAVAHNYFQSTEPSEDNLNGQSGQGAFYGLIPHAIPNSLEGMDSIATGKAFISTSNPHFWKKQDNHYCCQIYRLGCRADNPNQVPSVSDTHQVIGAIDGISTINKQNIISGWSCMHAMDASISVHLYAGTAEKGKFIGSYRANIASEEAVAQSCGAGGRAYRFQIPVDAKTSSQYSGELFYIYGISSIGLSNNALSRKRGVFRFPPPVISHPVLNSLPHIPVYRYLKGKDHLMTSDPSEGERAGFKAEGFKFYLFGSATGFELVPIYRCYISNDHFLSSDSRCEGAQVDGKMGNLLYKQISGTKPVYRFYKSSTGQHLITTNYMEGTLNGFKFERVLGYTL